MKPNNFRDIWTVIKFTMHDMVSRKSFRISTIIILVLIVLGFNAPNILNSLSGGEGFEDKVLFVDRDHLLGEISTENEQASQEDSTPNATQFWGQFTDEEIKEKLLNGEFSAAWIISKDERTNGISLQYLVKNRTTAPQPSTETILFLQMSYAMTHLRGQGFSEPEIQKIFPTVAVGVSQVDDQEVGGNIFVMMMLSIVLFFAIYFCAYQVSSSITIEKTSKIMETLVTSTSPRTIILGKTIGIGLVGLGQILLFAIVAIISAYSFLDPEILNSVLDLSNFTVYLAVIMIIYFILGYFAYALLYALTGSTVSKPEDIQSANTPVAILTMFGFYLAYFTLTDPTSSLNAFAALFPFSSPFCMPIRVMMGVASVWEVLLSLVILIITCAIIAHVAIKIYSSAILNYGNKMSLKDIVKAYKDRS